MIEYIWKLLQVSTDEFVEQVEGAFVGLFAGDEVFS